MTGLFGRSEAQTAPKLKHIFDLGGGMRKLLILGIALSTVGLITPAYGDAIFKLGNTGGLPGDQNVLFTMDTTGNPITGLTNHSDNVVQFTSSTNTLLHSSGGQADIDGVSGPIKNITMSIPGFTFGDAIINPFKPGADDDLKVTVVTNDGSFTKTYGSKNGQNFLTITTTAGEAIDSVTINSVSGFQDLKQPRISGPIDPIPEPSTFLLVGSGLLAFLLIQKKGRLVRFET
jgi:hypothetical protein